ncbi:MAG: hypothetical protein LBH35_10765 [Treponema sp.]|jgi:hypothetical protein|nr:hypothetical protein [Treponema sp.]
MAGKIARAWDADKEFCMKKLFWIILFKIMVIGFAGVQDFEFDFQNAAPNFSLNTLGFNNDLQPDLPADSRRRPIVGVPFLAGLMNMPLDLWSWINQDRRGDAVVSRLRIGPGSFPSLSPGRADLGRSRRRRAENVHPPAYLEMNIRALDSGLTATLETNLS